MTRTPQPHSHRRMARRRWFHSLFWLTLLGVFVVSHGCHGDEDNELSVMAEPHRTKKATEPTLAKLQATDAGLPSSSSAK